MIETTGAEFGRQLAARAAARAGREADLRSAHGADEPIAALLRVPRTSTDDESC